MANSSDWQVQDLAHYNTFALNFTEDTSLSASLLIPLDSLHRNTGEFRLVVYGGDVDNVPFPIEEVFSETPDQLKGLFLNIPCSSARLRLPNNCTACQWEDVTSMIRNVKTNRVPYMQYQHTKKSNPVHFMINTVIRNKITTFYFISNSTNLNRFYCYYRHLFYL